MNTDHQQIPFIKVCGITHQSPADHASAAGASMLGFIFHPNSPRAINAQRAAGVLSANVKRVGVFVKHSAADISCIMEKARLDYAQLHGTHSLDDATSIGTQRVIRVLWPAKHASKESLQAEIDQWSKHCAYYLLDAGTKGGGHGTRINLEQIEGLHFPKPWVLAGGIAPSMIQDIVKKCQPNGIDLNSKLEFAPGHKSNSLILQAFKQLN